MIGQCLNALDQKTQELRGFHSHRTTNAMSRNPLRQQAFDEPTCVLCHEGWLEAVDELASTATTLMMLLAAVEMTMFRVRWGTCTTDTRL
jgi:hypothetical protein